MQTYSTSEFSGLSLHQRLRSSTSEIHETLHHNPVLEVLTAKASSREQYALAIAGLMCFYRWVEAHLPSDSLSEEHRAFHIDTLSKLNADVAALKLDAAQLNLLYKDVTQSLEPLAFAQREEAHLGFLYLNLGSMLGGQVIAKNLRRSLPEDALCALHHFDGNKDVLNTHWRPFLAYLAESEGRVEVALVLQSALFYFHALETVLNEAYRKRQNYAP